MTKWNGRVCLVTYVIGDWPLKSECLWALNQEAEGLNLMLWWRTFLAWLNWVNEEDINILTDTELYKNRNTDTQLNSQ